MTFLETKIWKCHFFCCIFALEFSQTRTLNLHPAHIILAS